MIKMKKSLEPIEKDNVLIKQINGDRGVTYTFEYNANITFRWKQFKNHILENKITKEKVSYKDLIIVRDTENDDLYFYPDTVENYLKAYDDYKADKWAFEDDATLKEIRQDASIKELISRVDELTDIVKNLTNIVETQQKLVMANQGISLDDTIKKLQEMQKQTNQTQEKVNGGQNYALGLDQFSINTQLGEQTGLATQVPQVPLTPAQQMANTRLYNNQPMQPGTITVNRMW